MAHQFLLTPSSWLGQGKIQLNMVSEELSFFTRWNINNADVDGRIECLQEIQVKGLSDIMHNEFFVYNLTYGEFAIDHEKVIVGLYFAGKSFNLPLHLLANRLVRVGEEQLDGRVQRPKTARIRRR